MEDLFEANGWGDTWRDGICHYAHYHSRIHEVLGITRGKEAAALDAAGAALGAVGMLAFAAVFWWIVERSVAGAFAAASLAWLVVSITCWFARRKLRAVHRPRRNSDPAMSGSLGPGDTS
ncbi:hypothetical protein BJS_02356 [Bradyrhizobium japonicum SEMIA 5079]|jgi:hypothetical protein|nr:hypothetical protein BJS_02356 [Bradyrhizobium japonicum SEMIA 5079]